MSNLYNIKTYFDIISLYQNGLFRRILVGIIMDKTEIQLQPEIIETQQEILSFVDEERPSEIAFVEPSTDPFSHVSSDDRKHDIISFLKRAQTVLQGKLSTSNETGSSIFSISIPNDILTHPMYLDKLVGFRFIRGTLVIHLTHNAQPFQQGLYRMSTYPVVSPNNVYNSFLTSFKQFSGLNGVDMNLMNRDPVQIVVPFVYPTPAYDMLIQPDPWATVRLMCYLPLRSNGSSTVSFTVFAYFKDVEISMPISEKLPYVRSQKIAYASPQIGEEENPYNIALTEVKQPDNISVIVFRWVMFMLRYFFGIRMNTQVGSEERKVNGPISSIAETVGTVANTLTGIPLIGNYMKPVAGISAIVGNIASMFGFSKPYNEMPPTKFKYRMAENMNTADGVEITSNMALYNTNRVDVSKDLFGTTVDEMAFNYITRIPHYIGQFSLTTTTPLNSKIYDVLLNPLEPTMTFGDYSAGGTEIRTTSLGYVCSMFELWRGSLVFTFKAAKTVYHTTRLMIVWSNTEGATPDIYNQDMSYNYQVLWDITSSYEQTVVIPYVQSVEWLNIHQTDSYYKSNNGRLSIYVLNELCAASIASTQIDIGVEFSAGPDFSVQIPRNPRIKDYYVQPITTTGVIGTNVFMYIDVSKRVLFILHFGVTTSIPLDTSEILYPPNFEEWETSKTWFSRFNMTAHSKYTSQDGWQSWLSYKDNDGNNIVTDFNNIVGASIAVTRNGSRISVRPLSRERVNETDLSSTITNFVNLNIDPEEYKNLTSQKQNIDKNTHDSIKAYVETSLKNTALWITKVTSDKVYYMFGGMSYMLKILTEIELTTPVEMYITNDKGVIVNKIKKGNFTLRFITYDNATKKANLWIMQEKQVIFSEYINNSITPLQVMKSTTAQPQVAKFEALTTNITADITGGLVNAGQPHFSTIGEDVKSFRALLKRYTYYLQEDMYKIMNKQGFENAHQYFIFDPFYFGGDSDGVEGVTGQCDYLSYVAPLFRFFVGELRFKILLTNTTTGAPITSPVSLFLLNNYAAGTIPNLKTLNSSRIIYQQSLEGFIECTVPYYNRNYMTIIGDVREVALLSPILSRLLIVSTEVDRATVTIYRSFGEFTSFGYYMSAPTLMGIKAQPDT